jgi:hypothetical protein
MPPEERLLVGLLKQALLQRSDVGLPLLLIALTHLQVVQLVDLIIVGTREIQRVALGREELRERERRVVIEQVREIDGDLVVAALHCGNVRSRIGLLVFDFDADLTPLVDQEDSRRRVGHREIAVPENKLQVLLSSFLEKLARFGAGRLDVLAEARELDEFSLGCGKRRARANHAAHRAQCRNLRQALAAAPAIDCEQQCFANADIVERRLLVVEQHEQIQRPARFFHAELVAHRGDHAVTLGGRDATEFGQYLTALQCVEHRRGLQREHAPVAIEIGQPLLEIIFVALAGDMAAFHMLNESERARSVDLASWRGRIGGKVLCRINRVPRTREVIEHRRIRGLQLEDDRVRIWSVDRIDVGERGPAVRNHPLWRIAQPVIGRLDVGRRECGPVVKLDALVQGERVGQLVG